MVVARYCRCDTYWRSATSHAREGSTDRLADVRAAQDSGVRGCLRQDVQERHEGMQERMQDGREGALGRRFRVEPPWHVLRRETALRIELLSACL